MNENIELQAQGITDIFKLTDTEVIGNIANLIKAIDVDKIKKVMDMIEIQNDQIHIKLDITISAKNS